VTPPVVRDATAADTGAIGRVHVRAWQAAYRGVMSDAYLDSLRTEDREAMWHELLERRIPGVSVLVVENEGRAVVGFASLGPANDADRREAGYGELYSINLDPDVWGQGFGRSLLDEVSARLGRAGHPAAVLWVERENVRARRFYERAGWSPDGATKRAEVLGAPINEVRYQRALEPTAGSA
jgi:ribosomal protein S18 acetylase RimI-like enzyme